MKFETIRETILEKIFNNEDFHVFCDTAKQAEELFAILYVNGFKWTGEDKSCTMDARFKGNSATYHVNSFSKTVERL